MRLGTKYTFVCLSSSTGKPATEVMCLFICCYETYDTKAVIFAAFITFHTAIDKSWEDKPGNKASQGKPGN